MADVATESLGFRETSFGWPLEELWVAGDLLEFPQELDFGAVVLRFNLPVDELPWLREQQDADWAAERLRLGKRPFLYFYRPLDWPAWNCRRRRVTRFWSAKEGLQQDVIEAFSQRDASGLGVVEPSDSEFRVQLRAELAVSWRHLRYVLDQYDQQPWRNRKRYYPSEDPLWRAAEGVREIEDALAALNGS